MEVHFAVAILAGRGLTCLESHRGNKRTLRIAVVVVTAAILVLTCLFVTVLRPSDFHLGRKAPVTILRAPELFIPILVAAVSALAIWSFATRRRAATFLLFGVLAADLFLWGQPSGWYTSTKRIPEERKSAAKKLSCGRIKLSNPHNPHSI
jgi:hypothetical protein